MVKFTHREQVQKLDVSIDAQNEEVQYRTARTYHFDQDTSEGSESDHLVLVNVVFIVICSSYYSLPKSYEYFAVVTVTSIYCLFIGQRWNGSKVRGGDVHQRAGRMTIFL